MKCPRCESTACRKNGHRGDRQNYLCKNCGRQFTEAKTFDFVQQLEVEAVPVSNNGKNPTFLPNPGIAILLLDIENLKLDINTEKFLASVSNYPLQVKIAFANWRNSGLSKQDAELYDRGYQLIHVPEAKDSADAKMISVGASIFFHYPNVREVFVCSCDGILTHLCNQLQSQGITVYWVRRQNKVLAVENRNTGKINHYSLVASAEIPPLEAFANKIEYLLKEEQKSLSDRLESLSVLETLLQERCKLTGETKETVPGESKEQKKAKNSTSTKAKKIDSVAALETALIAIIQDMTSDRKGNTVLVNKLKNKFFQDYQETADITVKRLKQKSSLIKFLNSRPQVFKIDLVGKDYEVAIAPSE